MAVTIEAVAQGLEGLDELARSVFRGIDIAAKCVVAALICGVDARTQGLKARR